MGDIHERVSNFDLLEEQISKADLAIITGDLTQFGSTQEAQTVIETLERINPVMLAQLGNMDDSEIDSYLTDEEINIHGSGRNIKGVGIFGTGGSCITPFHTPTEFTEEELKSLLERGYSKVRDAGIKIMVCHTPPVNTRVDMISSGAHVGSTAVREFIEKYKPDLCITGHIHESAGEDTIGRTKIINPGPFYDGGYVWIEVEDGKVRSELRYIT